MNTTEVKSLSVDQIREHLGAILVPIHFTPIERKIMVALSDGKSHDNESLLPLIDSQATDHNLQDHISRIRDKIRPLGLEIVCEFKNRRTQYRFVLSLSLLASL